MFPVNAYNSGSFKFGTPKIDAPRKGSHSPALQGKPQVLFAEKPATDTLALSHTLQGTPQVLFGAKFKSKKLDKATIKAAIALHRELQEDHNTFHKQYEKADISATLKEIARTIRALEEDKQLTNRALSDWIETTRQDYWGTVKKPSTVYPGMMESAQQPGLVYSEENPTFNVLETYPTLSLVPGSTVWYKKPALSSIAQQALAESEAYSAKKDVPSIAYPGMMESGENPECLYPDPNMPAFNVRERHPTLIPDLNSPDWYWKPAAEDRQMTDSQASSQVSEKEKADLLRYFTPKQASAVRLLLERGDQGANPTEIEKATNANGQGIIKNIEKTIERHALAWEVVRPGTTPGIYGGQRGVYKLQRKNSYY